MAEYRKGIELNPGVVVLKPRRDESVRRRHPWLFSGGVAEVRGQPQPGDVVEVHGAEGEWLARGFFNPASEMRVRLATWNVAEPLDEAWLRRQLQAAIERRRELVSPSSTDACRLAFIESDGLPGLIVDRYGDFLVVQLNNPAMERWREPIVQALLTLVQPRGVFERSDDDLRTREGLPLRVGILSGEAPPEQVTITEHGLRFQVEVRTGHKTGFYLDQRESRLRTSTWLSRGSVLNAFAYTGAFAVYALRAGAEHVVNLDSSAEVLRLAEVNAELNGFAGRTESIVGNAFEVLRRFRDEGRQFEAIVLDPPRFAQSRAAVPRASRGYKDLNLLAMKLLRTGGRLVTFSCSGLISAELFQQILFAAALDSGREVRIIQRLGQGVDHPVLLTFPEAGYLKGFVCVVD